MNNIKNTFIEVCIYEVKLNKIDEFETLIEKVAKHHKQYPGVIDVKYMKRTHRQGSFFDVKSGKPAIALTRKPQSVTYVLFWELDNVITHGKATKSGLQKFYKDFTRCLTTIPKIILGTRIQ